MAAKATALQELVHQANLDLAASGLVMDTFGNLSAVDRRTGMMVIKPSGMPYASMTPADMVTVSLMTGVTLAHTSNQPPHQLYRIGDLKLESGDVIKDFAISYVTHGTLNAKKSNAILMVTAISGNHRRLDFSSGPAKRWTPTNSSSFAPTRLEMD